MIEKNREILKNMSSEELERNKKIFQSAYVHTESFLDKKVEKNPEDVIMLITTASLVILELIEEKLEEHPSPRITFIDLTEEE